MRNLFYKLSTYKSFIVEENYVIIVNTEDNCKKIKISEVKKDKTYIIILLCSEFAIIYNNCTINDNIITVSYYDEDNGNEFLGTMLKLDRKDIDYSRPKYDSAFILIKRNIIEKLLYILSFGKIF